MKSALTSDYWGNAIAMLRAGKPLTPVVVSGRQHDADFIAHWLDPSVALIAVDVAVESVVTAAKDRGCRGVIGLTSQVPPESDHDLASIDFGDADTLLAGSGALYRAIVEVAGRDWHTKMCAVISNLSKHIAAIAVVENMFSESVELDEKAMTPCLERHATEFASQSSKADADVLWAAPGALMVAAACRLLEKCKPDDISCRRVPSEAELRNLMRVAFGDDEFARTRLHWRLRMWELREGMRVIRSVRRRDPLGVLIDQSYYETDIRRICGEIELVGGFCVVQIDLDNFGAINKASGHDAGDEAIRRYGRIVSEAVDKHGDAYRRGGDEVVVVLPGLGEAQAAAIAESLRSRIEAAFQETAQPNAPTASIGVAEAQAGADVFQVVALADAAQRRAKAAGKNRVVRASEISILN